MKKLILLAALMPFALAACDDAAPYQNDDAPVQTGAAPADHTLRDGLIGGALGYMAGRASQPAQHVQQVQQIHHYTTHVYRPAYNRPVYSAPYRPAYRPSYGGGSVFRTTTITRSYRR